MIALYALLVVPLAAWVYCFYLRVVAKAVEYVVGEIDWQSDDLRWNLRDDEGKIE